MPAKHQLTTRKPDGGLRLNFHAGQLRAWHSLSRFILVLAGAQSGKSSFGPWWLWREARQRGPGDYLVVTPTFPLMALKALPEFLKVWKQMFALGEFTGSPIRRFVVSKAGEKALWGATQAEPTTIYFGHAADPDSLEAATIKAVWCDEAGQKKFRLGSWEALLRRLSVNEGRALLTTTPYDLGWLKQQLFDRWLAADKKHAEIDVVRFRSIDNPAFPRAEYDRARRTLPAWKFSMFYNALFTRPAGLIFDAFDDTKHKVPRFAIPTNWPRYLGLDFGGVNTAAVFFAEEPNTKRLYAYRTYHKGGQTARGHAEALKAGEPGLPLVCVGGSKSEGQWREEFAAAGFPVRAPEISDVEVGIDRVFGTIKQDQLFVFDDLAELLDELASYSRPVDDAGQPQPGIEDKNSYHLLDSIRAIVPYIRNNYGDVGITTAPRSDSLFASLPVEVAGELSSQWDDDRDREGW